VALVAEVEVMVAVAVEEEEEEVHQWEEVVSSSKEMKILLFE
jgi:hypothetical protein